MDFDQQFPPKRVLFSRSLKSASEWVEAKYGEGYWWDGDFVLAADDLLKRVLSWYENTNIFAHPSFSMKLTRFRTLAAIMANDKKNYPKPTKRPTWNGFLDFRLDDDQLAELDEWQPSAVEVFEHVDGVMLAGFRLTLSYNAQTKLANCTIIDDRLGLPSSGFALSTADLSCGAALKAAVYKHSLVLQGDWSSLLTKPSAGGRRG